MIELTSKLYQRLGLITSAFIMAISGMIISAPFYFSQVANAIVDNPVCSNVSSFDGAVTGSLNGQDGWSVTGPYDQAIVNNTYGYSNFGCKSLRLSNAITSGSFGDQIFSSSNVNESGETSATSGGVSGGVRQNHFEAQFDFASTQAAQQPGLFVSVSPDRGDGSRMSYLGFSDGIGGIDVSFYDVQGTTNPANFVQTVVATGLSRAVAHTAKFVIDYVDGPSNDVVSVYIDSVLVHKGTTWENYYRFDTESSAEQTPRTTDNLLFRVGGNAVPATINNGFLFDNINLSSTIILPDTTAPAIPVLLSPVDGVYRHTSDANFSDWSDVTDPSGVGYRYQSASDIGFTNIYYDSNNYGSLLNESKIMNPGEPEVGYYWRVQACDNLGNCSAWSTPGKINIDNTDPSVPTNGAPYNTILATNNFDFNWAKSTDDSPVTYVFQSSQNPTSSDGVLTSGLWTSGVLPTNMIHSSGAGDGAWYWQVRAIDAAGNKSAWSKIWKVTLDTVTPNYPTAMLFAGGSNILTNGYTDSKTFTFNLSSSADTSRYQLKYWNDISSSPYKENSPWNPTNLSGYSSSLGVYNDQFTQGDGTHYFAFSACDAAGNCSEYSTPFAVTYDNTAPVIKLVGDDVVTITIGDNYIDDGATAVDNIDSLITNKIVANSNVDSTKVGEYTVTYDVSDSAGNVADQVSRLVKVVAKEIPAAITPSVLGATTTAPVAVRVASGEVLGETTTEAADDASEAKDISTSKSKAEGEVKGSSDSKNEDKPWYDVNIIGLAWYWWVLIVAAVVGLLWFILGRRSENGQE